MAVGPNAKGAIYRYFVFTEVENEEVARNVQKYLKTVGGGSDFRIECEKSYQGCSDIDDSWEIQ